MTVFEFFRESPVLATFLTLIYAALWAVLVYMFIHMYRKKSG